MVPPWQPDHRCCASPLGGMRARSPCRRCGCSVWFIRVGFQDFPQFRRQPRVFIRIALLYFS